MIEPHPLFASFQPLVQTIKTYGECHGTSYDDRDGGELLGVININVRPGLLEPRQDQTVETIIQDYFNKQTNNSNVHQSNVMIVQTYYLEPNHLQ